MWYLSHLQEPALLSLGFRKPDWGEIRAPNLSLWYMQSEFQKVDVYKRMKIHKIKPNSSCGVYGRLQPSEQSETVNLGILTLLKE